MKVKSNRMALFTRHICPVPVGIILKTFTVISVEGSTDVSITVIAPTTLISEISAIEIDIAVHVHVHVGTRDHVCVHSRIEIEVIVHIDIHEGWWCEWWWWLINTRSH